MLDDQKDAPRLPVSDLGRDSSPGQLVLADILSFLYDQYATQSPGIQMLHSFSSDRF